MYIFGHLRQRLDIFQNFAYGVAQLPERVHETVKGLIDGSSVHLDAREQALELGALLLTHRGIYAGPGALGASRGVTVVFP